MAVPRVIHKESPYTCLRLFAQTYLLQFAQERQLNQRTNIRLRVSEVACVLYPFGHESAYGLLGGRAHAPVSVWVHTYFCFAIYNERWALISFGDICVPACHCFGGYTLTIPPPHTLPYYPWTKHPTCPLSQLKTIGGGLPLSIMGARWRNL